MSDSCLFYFTHSSVSFQRNFTMLEYEIDVLNISAFEKVASPLLLEATAHIKTIKHHMQVGEVEEAKTRIIHCFEILESVFDIAEHYLALNN